MKSAEEWEQEIITDVFDEEEHEYDGSAMMEKIEAIREEFRKEAIEAIRRVPTADKGTDIWKGKIWIGDAIAALEKLGKEEEK